MNSKTTYRSLLWIFLLTLIPILCKAQISLNAESTALGGGGTAYLTGYESLFVNPANLFIQEKSYGIQISALQGGFYYDSMFPIANSNRLDNYRDANTAFDFSTPSATLNENSREQLLQRNFFNSRDVLHNQSQSEFYWFGIKWIRENRNYAATMRTRVGNRQQISRGQFSSEIIEEDETSLFDQSFRHQYQVLHEISFGYAESFTFLNGLIPQLSEFIVGIAPKIVLPGAYLDVDYKNTFEKTGESIPWIQENKTVQQTAGPFSQQALEYFQQPSASPQLSSPTINELINPSGIGMALDMGITYLVTFGDDLSVIDMQESPTEKSLRLSLSVSDVGAVHYFDSPLSYESNRLIRERENLDPVSELSYSGAPNEHYAFLGQNGSFIQAPRYTQNSDGFTALLPTSIQTGALFQINRIKLMGDLSYSFSNTAFQKSGLQTHFGAEIRPFRFLPLRAGTRFANKEPGFYSFGTGIETNTFDLNVAVMIRHDNMAATSEIVGASVVGLKIYLQ